MSWAEAKWTVDSLLQKIGQSWCNVKANCINRKTYGNTAQRSPIENG